MSCWAKYTTPVFQHPSLPLLCAPNIVLLNLNRKTAFTLLRLVLFQANPWTALWFFFHHCVILISLGSIIIISLTPFVCFVFKIVITDSPPNSASCSNGLSVCLLPSVIPFHFLSIQHLSHGRMLGLSVGLLHTQPKVFLYYHPGISFPSFWCCDTVSDSYIVFLLGLQRSFDGAHQSSLQRPEKECRRVNILKLFLS